MTTLTAPPQRTSAGLSMSAATSARPAPLGQRLVDAGLLTVEELESALQEQRGKGMRLGHALLEMGLVQEDELLPFFADQLAVPAVNLREGLIDPAAVQLLPKALAKQHSALPTFCVDGILTLAMSEPQNLIRID